MRSIFVVPVLAVMVLTGCASRSGFEPYEAEAGAEKGGDMSYRLAAVELSLGGDEATARYPDQDALQAAFDAALQAQIEARGLSGQGYDLEVTVKWERRMVGARNAPKDVFSSAVCWFDSRIIQDGTVVARDGGDPLNAGSIKYEHKNILNNLKRIGDTVTRTGDPASEQRELERCAKLLVERLPK